MSKLSSSKKHSYTLKIQFVLCRESLSICWLLDVKSSFILPHVVPNLYDFLSYVIKTKRVFSSSFLTLQVLIYELLEWDLAEIKVFFSRNKQRHISWSDLFVIYLDNLAMVLSWQQQNLRIKRLSDFWNWPNPDSLISGQIFYLLHINQKHWVQTAVIY